MNKTALLALSVTSLALVSCLQNRGDRIDGHARIRTIARPVPVAEAPKPAPAPEVMKPEPKPVVEQKQPEIAPAPAPVVKKPEPKPVVTQKQPRVRAPRRATLLPTEGAPSAAIPERLLAPQDIVMPGQNRGGRRR